MKSWSTKSHISLFLFIGGPLYDKDNDVVVGVTSWGVGCGMGKAYKSVGRDKSLFVNIFTQHFTFLFH